MRKNTSLLMIALLSVAIISCSKKSEESSTSPSLSIEEQNAATNTVDAEKPPAKKVQTAAEKREALVGVWVLSSADCDSSDGIIFANNGKYSSAEETGTWEMDGDKLVVNAKTVAASEEGGENHDNGDNSAGGGELANKDELAPKADTTSKSVWTLKVFEVDNKKAVLHRAGGSNVIWKRCPQSPNL